MRARVCISPRELNLVWGNSFFRGAFLECTAPGTLGGERKPCLTPNTIKVNRISEKKSLLRNIKETEKCKGENKDKVSSSRLLRFFWISQIFHRIHNNTDKNSILF